MVLCAALGLTPPLLGQGPVPKLPSSKISAGTIRDISLSRAGEGLIIEVTTDAPIIPETTRLQHPDRLVFDFPGFTLAGGARRIPVNRGPVVTVRASLFQYAPPMGRIVVDLKQPVEPELRSEGNKLRIHFRIGEAVAGDRQNAADRQPPAERGGSVSPQSQAASLTASSQSPSRGQPSEYELLARARALTLDDLKAVEEKSAAGDPEAETVLALAYHSAVLLRNDEAEALRLLHQAADHGFMAAQESLGIFYAAGIGMPEPNPQEALAWYGKAARQGSVDAATNLATMYATGDGVPRDTNAAIPWFLQAAEAGGSAAQYNLAVIYGRGDGVPRDDQKSLEWLVKAADQGVIPALLDLGNRSLHPSDGSKPDVPAAIQRFQRAAELGDARAQAMLGDVFSLGALVPPDYPQAVKWYRMAADQGQKDGEFGLAARYVLGQGVPVDDGEAFRWFKAAAEQGHADAQYDLGRMYEVGKGVDPDLAQAVHYYELAAQQGVVKAQYQLGRLLAKGEGVPSDSVAAYKWLLLAQDSVHESRIALNGLRKTMAPGEIMDAEHQVDAWRIAHKGLRREAPTP